MCSSCFYNVFGVLNFLFPRARVRRVDLRIASLGNHHFGNSRSSGRRTFSWKSTAKLKSGLYILIIRDWCVYPRVGTRQTFPFGISLAVGKRHEGKREKHDVHSAYGRLSRQVVNQSSHNFIVNNRLLQSIKNKNMPFVTVIDFNHFLQKIKTENKSPKRKNGTSMRTRFTRFETSSIV